MPDEDAIRAIRQSSWFGRIRTGPVTRDVERTTRRGPSRRAPIAMVTTVTISA